MPCPETHDSASIDRFDKIGYHCQMGTVEFAQKAVVVFGGKLLLVRKSRDDPYNADLWDLPGGRMKSGESVDDHLQREVWEETGVHVKPGKPLTVWSWTMGKPPDDVTVVAISRLCTAESDAFARHNREVDDYIEDCAWINLEDLGKYEIIPSQRPTIDALLGLVLTAN